MLWRVWLRRYVESDMENRVDQLMDTLSGIKKGVSRARAESVINAAFGDSNVAFNYFVDGKDYFCSMNPLWRLFELSLGGA